jgi:iron complex outermembrane receptor protein
MRTSSLRGAVHSKANGARLAPKASVSAAVFFALYGVPHPGSAQQAPSDQKQAESSPSTLQVVVVTAQRREQTLESIPFSLSVVSADQIARAGVTDIASLASQVPGLSMYDFGARDSSVVFPVIRGLNASAANGGIVGGGGITANQSPVGMYIGNSPINGYFQLDDIQRIEVLRGPQGTLYGAGALGGALRVIPNAPELEKFAGNVEVGGGTLAHSSGASYITSAMLNLPIGDTLAFRVSGKYDYEPGFINVYGILERNSSGIPVLANPADPVNSSGIFAARKNDWNDQRTFTGRASLLWKPTDKFNAQLAFMYAKVNGDGGPVDSPTSPGGPYPIDPRIQFPPGGDYQYFIAVDQPFSQETQLSSLDLSYDVGFATLSSTSSYYTTKGSTVTDGTYLDDSFPPAAVGYYYAGNPINPRFVVPVAGGNTAHTFTQELRLVSTTGPEKLFDYVVGLFYENQDRAGSTSISNPGSPERSVAEGCTAPYFFGATFPDCLVTSGPGDLTFQSIDTQKFQDKSEFGELTWHFTSHGQITFGGRHFEQSYTDVQSYSYWTFSLFVPPESRSAPASKNTWKINPSYEYATDQYVYALWSQGFRRGGANAVPTAGLFAESPLLLSYVPDSTNNYEVGLKGRFANGISYTFDVFDVLWDKPQVAGGTPGGNGAVWNANKAKSTGVEFDLKSPLFLPGLSITASGTYANARFTEDYFIAADVFGNIVGKAGQQLPGSSKTSAAATLNYEHNLAADYDLTISLNDTYRSAMPLSTFGVLGGAPAEVSGMQIANASASVAHNAWRLGLYVTNIADKRVILQPPSRPGHVNGLTTTDLINPPREIDLRLRYSF